jgi:5-methylthioadenosine/S-adenosylhomocysteine deaminase
MAKSSLKIADAEYVLTVDAQRRILRNASILVEGDRITAIGSAAELADAPADRVIDGSAMLVTPGFVDTHNHLDSQILRCAFGDTYGPEYIPATAKARAVMTEEQSYLGTLVALTEFLRSGTTCIVTPGDTPHLYAAIDAHVESGARTMVGSQVSDVDNPLQVPVLETEAALADLERTLGTYDGLGNGRIRAWVTLSHATEWVSRDLVVGAKRLADEHGTGLTVHQSARQAQVDNCLAQHGMRPVEYLQDIGVAGPNVLLAHCLLVDDHEIEIMARTGLRAGMCPQASLRLGMGTSTRGRLPEMLEAGITVGLGTDSTEFGPADVLHAAFLDATLYKDGRGDPSLIPAETALELATIGGATAAGIDHEIGSLQVGKKADLVLFDTRRPEWRPLFNPVSQLIYTAGRQGVHTVIVDGSIRVEARRATFVSETDLAQRVQDQGEQLLREAGLAVSHRWPVHG